MKLIRKIAFAIVALTATLAAPDSFAQAQTIHLVTVFDATCELIRDSARIDAGLIEKFFERNKKREGLKVDVTRIALDDPAKKAKSYVLAQIKALNVGPDDVIVFYYSGHGAHGGGKAEGGKRIGHYLRLYPKIDAGEDEYRVLSKDIRGELDDKNARFVFIFTDCCNIIEGKAAPRKGDVAAREMSASAFDELFLKPEGVVHITSSQYGQYSIALNNGKGSLGTLALIDAFNYMEDEIENLDGQNAWNVAFELLTEKSDLLFHEEFPHGLTDYGQTTQTPHAFDLDEPRLGARAQVDEESGRVVVTEIADVSPPAPAQGVLETGDIIVKINGIDVVDEDVFEECVDASPKKAVFVVRRGGEEREITIKLKGEPKKKTLIAPAPSDADEKTSDGYGGGTMKGGALLGAGVEKIVGKDGEDAFRICRLELESPADVVGLKNGDLVVSIGRVKIISKEQFANVLEQSAGKTVVVKFVRDGKKSSKEVRVRSKSV